MISAGVLWGRRVVVTGAATGIGRAAVEAMTAEGASLVAVYHRTPPPSALCGLAEWVQCDLRNKKAVSDVFERSVQHLGGLDVLLHAAGLWAPATPEGVTEGELDEMLAVNFKATVFTNQAAHVAMTAGGGAIVNLGSVEGVAGAAISAHYASAKAAVHAWTRSAARSWGAEGITVNTVAPCVDTTNADRVREYFGPDGAAVVAERMRQQIPLGGAFGDATRDLCPVLVFLAGTGARFITGQLIAVDGGMRMVSA